MYHVLVHSSVDGHLGCFLVLTVVNGAAMNLGVHVSFQIMFSSGYMPRSGIAGSYGRSVLEMFFKENDLCLNNLENAIPYLPCLQS